MIFFFYGQNGYELRQEVRRLVDAYVKKTGSNFGLDRIDGSKVTAGELSQSLQAVPFLAASRLVVIDDLGSNKKVAASIDKFLSGIPDSTVAVFCDPTVDRRTGYFKVLSTSGKVVEFKPLSSSQLESWVRKETGRQGGKIGPQAARRLIELAGEDQWRLSGEIAKLVNYNTEIGISEIDLLVEPGFSETIFSLVDAMTAGRAGVALDLFRNLVQQRTNEIYILTMIQWQLRNLLLAKSAGAIAPAELAKRASISPYVASKAMAKQQSFSLDTLKAAFAAAVDCEYQIKSGETPAAAAVEQLIYQVATNSVN